MTRISLIGAAFVAFTSGTTLAGAIIGVPGDQPTIQAAIAAASNGDRIEVSPGTYNEIISFLGKQISVYSTDGPAVTTIDATGIPDGGRGVPVVRFEGGEGPVSLLEGFTITGGTGDTDIFGVGSLIGGGIVMSNASPTIARCVITGNTAELGAGAFSDGGNPTFRECTFISNDADLNGDGVGGGLYLFFGGGTITDCSFTNNTAQQNSAALQINRTLEPVHITGSTFTSNTSPGSNGGCIEADLRGGMTIDGCHFEGNSVQSGNGGCILISGGNATFLNTTFSNNAVNQVGGQGGALYLAGDSALVANCLFYGNTAGLQAGAILVDNDDTEIINTTLSGNGSNEASAIYLVRTAESSALLTNLIVWENFGASDQILTDFSGGPVTINHSIVQGGWAGDGTNNSVENPLFTNPGSDDYTLLPASPAIDAGDTLTAAAAFASTTDIAGEPRLVDDPVTANTGVEILGTNIDLGASEFQPSNDPACLADLSGDGILDLADIGLFVTNFTTGCP